VRNIKRSVERKSLLLLCRTNHCAKKAPIDQHLMVLYNGIYRFDMSNVRNVGKYGAEALMFDYKRENYYIGNSGDP